jgi:hypothetical protein
LARARRRACWRVARALHYKSRVIVVRKSFSSKGSASEKRLLHRVRGDRERLERLIQLELLDRPGMSRAAAAQATLDRWACELVAQARLDRLAQNRTRHATRHWSRE